MPLKPIGPNLDSNKANKFLTRSNTSKVLNLLVTRSKTHLTWPEKDNSGKKFNSSESISFPLQHGTKQEKCQIIVSLFFSWRRTRQKEIKSEAQIKFVTSE